MSVITTNEMHCVLKMYLLAHGMQQPQISQSNEGIIIQVCENKFKCRSDEALLNLRGGAQCEPGSLFMLTKCRRVTRCIHNICNKEDCIRALRDVIPIYTCKAAEPTHDNSAVEELDTRLKAVEKTLDSVVDLLNRLQIVNT
jgi:hypothetical protein